MVAAYLVGTKGRPRDAVPSRRHRHDRAHGRCLRARLRDARALCVHRPGAAVPVADARLGRARRCRRRIGAQAAPPRARTRQHHHDHDHEHDHETLAHHDHDDALTSKGILGVGVAAGLLPCPSALVVLLSAIALHRIGLGLALIVAFSIGLAATITAIGLVAVLARRTFGRLSLDGPLVRALPAVSAALILRRRARHHGPRAPGRRLVEPIRGRRTNRSTCSGSTTGSPRSPTERPSASSCSSQCCSACGTRPIPTTSRR